MENLIGSRLRTAGLVLACCAALLCSVAILAPQRAVGATPTASYQSETAPLEVAVADQLPLRDPARGRVVLTRIYYPVAPGSYPVIIFSHGFGGDLGAFENTSRYWAARGYVVVHPTHIDSVRHPDPAADPQQHALIVRFLTELVQGHVDPATQTAFVPILNDPRYVDSRVADVEFLLKALADPHQIDPQIVAREDLTRLGMGGHSFGAYTTQALAGEKLSFPGLGAVDRSDGRFRAFMPISGQGAGRMGLADDSFSAMTRPMMSITGTKDFGAGDETPRWRLEPFEHSPPGNKYALTVPDFSHLQFDPPTGTEPGDDLKAFELAFWDAYLKDSPSAKSYLAAGASETASASAIAFERR